MREQVARGCYVVPPEIELLTDTITIASAVKTITVNLHYHRVMLLRSTLVTM